MLVSRCPVLCTWVSPAFLHLWAKSSFLILESGFGHALEHLSGWRSPLKFHARMGLRVCFSLGKLFFGQICRILSKVYVIVHMVVIVWLHKSDETECALSSSSWEALFLPTILRSWNVLEARRSNGIDIWSRYTMRKWFLIYQKWRNLQWLTKEVVILWTDLKLAALC